MNINSRKTYKINTPNFKVHKFKIESQFFLSNISEYIIQENVFYFNINFELFFWEKMFFLEIFRFFLFQEIIYILNNIFIGNLRKNHNFPDFIKLLIVFYFQKLLFWKCIFKIIFYFHNFNLFLKKNQFSYVKN